MFLQGEACASSRDCAACVNAEICGKPPFLFSPLSFATPPRCALMPKSVENLRFYFPLLAAVFRNPSVCVNAEICGKPPFLFSPLSCVTPPPTRHPSHLYPTTDCLQWVQTAASRVDGYWSIDLTDLKLGRHSALRTKATAILDTGTSMVVGPYVDVGYVADQIGGWCIRLAGSDSSTVEEVRRVC